MRLALLSRRFHPLVGGAERVMAALAGELARRGAEVTVYAQQFDAAWPACDERDGYRICRIASSAKRWWGTWRFMQRLGSALCAARPDLIYASMLKQDAYVACRVAARLRLPVVLRPEGAGATGDIAWQATARCGARIRHATRGADRFVALSGAIYDELVSAGYSADKLVRIPNGVALPPAPKPWDAAPLASLRRNLGVDPHGPWALYVGRLAPEKGVTDLVRAWPAIRAAVPSFRLAIVGDGPLREPLRELAYQSANHPGIFFVGACDAVADWMRACDLFILPSHEEGMSIALLEAMACGMPIVASDIPGNRALLAGGAAGWLTPPGSPDQLAQAVVAAFAQAATWRDRGCAARALVAADYSIGAMGEAHQTLFRALLGARPG